MTNARVPTGDDVATLGGGCFWCLEAVFRDVVGVDEVVSGYAGGSVADPTYEQVCTGQTGHAEVVHLRFDPARIPYADLLGIFFGIHDPTTVDRQGGDVGPQYRSVIFFHSDAQQRTAREVIQRLNAQRVWPRPVVTEVVAATAFYPAEEYHQRYFERNPNQGYCRAIIAPKVAKFRHQFDRYLRSAASPARG